MINNSKDVQRVPKDALVDLVEPSIFSRLNSSEYIIYTDKAYNYLTYNRFGIAFKLLFLQMLDKCYEYGEEVYLEHIKAFSLGAYTEPGNKEKVGKLKFINTFIELHKDIIENGFDVNKSIIPLSNKNHIKNGAHRLAAAIFNNRKVYLFKTEGIGPLFDYKYFHKRGVRKEFLDAAAIAFTEYSPNVYLAMIWPSAGGKGKEIHRILNKVVYEKKIYLSWNGARNLLAQVYHTEPWIGNQGNNFRGVGAKLVECFNSSNPLRLILFQSDGVQQVIQQKEEIRTLFGIGKHSVHITDTHDDTVRLSKILFNDNGIHFLNYARPNRFNSFHKDLLKIKSYIETNGLSNNDIIIDSGMILAAYGIREANDIDVVSIHSPHLQNNNPSSITDHSLELKYHGKSIERLLYDYRNYFWFDEIKFISFAQLEYFKRKRNSKKDIRDLEMMKKYLVNNSRVGMIRSLKRKIQFITSKITFRFEKVIGLLLKKIGLYDKVNALYLKIKRR